MDAWEATKVVFERLRALDPDNASKMMGMLLIQDNSDKELIRLAFGPDRLLHAFVSTARAELAAKPAVLGSPCSPGGGADHQSSFAGEAGAWRPCMYFARGYCKNGSSCRFLHDDLPVLDDSTAAEQEMAAMHAKALAAARMASVFPFLPSPRTKGVSLNFLLHHQQQHEHSQRAAAAMLLDSEDMHRFPARSPRIMEHGGDLIGSPAARQIYLTFPADSTFTEKDVSNYFSMYGPVQDVRIPYQQKRMFGFVTFVYEESVRIILNKGNPHFVCNSRVLVKPYKDKAKVPDRLRNLHHPHHGDFVGCTSPTGLLDSRDPFDLQQPQIGPRMMHGNIANHEALLRRKLEAQQQAAEAELQQAIELEGQRFVRPQLLDLKSRGYRLGSTNSLGQADGTGNINGNGNAVNLEDFTIQDNNMNSTGLAMSAPPAATISATDAEGRHEEQQEEDGDADASPKQVVNPGEEEKMESGPVTATPNVACGFQENGVVEHIFPENPFASPTKSNAHTSTTTAQNVDINNTSPYHVASSLFPPTSTLELRPYNSCFFQVPRFSPGHEAIGL